MHHLVADPLLSSARVLDGLFYSGAVIVESDSDARFYHAASSKRRNDLDLHFVNADNKQTVPRITKLYQSMGVRSAGIVDFDVLNNQPEFREHLDTIGVGDREREICLYVRQKIDEEARVQAPEERLRLVLELIGELHSSIQSYEATESTESGSRERLEHLLRGVDSKCKRISSVTKPWRQLKEHGQSALPSEIQERFEDLRSICMSRGLFINPVGELESMLVEYGIQYSTEKRLWIQRALKLISGLQVYDSKQPWKLIKEVQDYLAPDSRVDTEQ